MSAKLSVIVYILICLEVGLLLVLLPWLPYWEENFFLDFIAGRMGAPGVAAFLQTGYVRGAVSALGLLNLLAGLRDLIFFRQSVNALEGWDAPAPALPTDVEKSSNSSTHLPRH